MNFTNQSQEQLVASLKELQDALVIKKQELENKENKEIKEKEYALLVIKKIEQDKQERDNLEKELNTYIKVEPKEINQAIQDNQVIKINQAIKVTPTQEIKLKSSYLINDQTLADLKLFTEAAIIYNTQNNNLKAKIDIQELTNLQKYIQKELDTNKYIRQEIHTKQYDFLNFIDESTYVFIDQLLKNTSYTQGDLTSLVAFNKFLRVKLDETEIRKNNQVTKPTTLLYSEFFNDEKISLLNMFIKGVIRYNSQNITDIFEINVQQLQDIKDAMQKEVDTDKYIKKDYFVGKPFIPFVPFVEDRTYWYIDQFIYDVQNYLPSFDMISIRKFQEKLREVLDARKIIALPTQALQDKAIKETQDMQKLIKYVTLTDFETDLTNFNNLCKTHLDVPRVQQSSSSVAIRDKIIRLNLTKYLNNIRSYLYSNHIAKPTDTKINKLTTLVSHATVEFLDTLLQNTSTLKDVNHELYMGEMSRKHLESISKMIKVELYVKL